MTHVHTLFQPLIFRPFSQVSLPLPSLVTAASVSLSFLFFSFFFFHLSLSLSSPFSPAHFPSELRARRQRRRHEHACVNRPILLQLYRPIYNCCFPTYEGDSGLARDSRGFLHVPILLLLHRRTADPSSLVSGQIPSSL